MERHLPQGESATLTAFQKKVLADEQFWRDWSADAPVRNLMVQGATSAGKTLLSELNILDTIQNGKTAIVLVPLKAMVHERTKQFRHDMGGETSGGEINVFGSSSDYMDNDERLIAGDYTVAIIVYEKFFAMISQGYTQLMKNCGLLVVDELTMVGLDQRGPKLEMSLEIVKKKHPETRIMCLATCDCSTKHVCEWLDIERPIVSTARPVALEEHILMLNGNGRYRTIPKDHESVTEGSSWQEEIEIGTEKLEIEGYSGNQKIDRKKEALLLTVMKRIFAESSDSRVLVFVSAQAKAAKIADFLRDHRSEWMPRQVGVCSDDFRHALQACERDEGQEALVNSLIPEGIAYHHAGLSTNLRELIEAQFSDPDSHLRVIVATETLTVGVNMPFDAMIMVDHQVWRGKGVPVSLNQQEYRNYIGRAGRLGQSNRIGKTFLFVEGESESEYYWNSYGNREEVLSSLVKADESVLAPYYLSLLNNRLTDLGHTVGTAMSPEHLQTLYDSSLSKRCSARERIDVKKLHYYLNDAYLVSNLTRPAAMGAVGRNATRGEVFQIEQFGTHMAPFALSTQTCIMIYYYFYEGYLNGAFPASVTKEDIESDRYLLEILYHVCCHPEVTESTCLRYPMNDSNVTLSFTAKKRVLDCLRRLTEQTDENGAPQYTLWCDSYEVSEEEHRALQEGNHLWQLLNDTNLSDENEKLQAAMRAIVLLHWTQGVALKDIKKKTGFGDITKLIGGDIERLAEVVSFHMDAIYKSLGTAFSPEDKTAEEERAQTLKAFYFLTKRVKYGMSRDLVVLANKHIHGLDRSHLLKLQMAAAHRKLSPLHFLYFMPAGSIPEDILTVSQHRQLVQEMESRGATNSIDVLLRIVENDTGPFISDKVLNAIRHIWNWNKPEADESGSGVSAETLCEALDTIFDTTSTFAAVTASSKIKESSARIRLKLKENEEYLRIGICTSLAEDKELAKFFGEDAEDNDRNSTARLLIVPAGLNKTQMLELKERYDAHAVMDNIYFAFTLGQILRLSTPQDAVFPFFADLRGIFSETERGYCPILRYIRRTPHKTNAGFYLIRNGAEPQFEQNIGAQELTCALSNEGLGDYEELAWGDVLNSDAYDFSECPTVILLNRDDVVKSESLTRFLYRMRSQNFENCLLVLNSRRELEEWKRGTSDEDKMYNCWDQRNARISIVVPESLPDALNEIRTFIKVWQRKEFLIGVSYAHFSSQQSDYPQSDRYLLDKLVGMLRDEYGEDRILYDRYSRAGRLFGENNAVDISLNGYRECKYYLILWNWWTKNERNCEREREVIFEECQNGEKRYRFLVTGNEKDPPMEEQWRSFSDMLTSASVDRIFADIKRSIGELL